MFKKLFTTLALLIAGGMLGACGQKGPLYLPQAPAAPAQPGAAAAVPASAETAPEEAQSTQPRDANGEPAAEK